MNARHKARNRVLAAVAWLLTGLWVVAMVLLIRPYHDVSFPKGNTATVHPVTVGEGGTVVVTFPAFCNNGRVVTVDRYADVYMDGRLAASERLGSLTFYPDGPYCREPEVQEVALTSAFQAYGGKATQYRLRTVTSYRVPLRTITVEAATEVFTVTTP